MKKSFIILFFVLLVICVAGCSGDSSTQTKEDKIYLNNSPLSEKSLDFDFLKFYDDNTFQGVDTSSKSYYGTYTIDGNSLTLDLADKTYAGVVLDNGAGVTFGNDQFTDWTGHIKDTDPLLETFK